MSFGSSIMSHTVKFAPYFNQYVLNIGKFPGTRLVRFVTAISRGSPAHSKPAWKRVELKAVRVLEQFRAQRLRIDRIEQYQNRLATMKVAVLSFRRDFGPAIFPLFPRYHEFAALPEIEQIITSPLPITPDTFSCLSDMIPGYLENWKQMTSDSLEALLRDSVDSDLPGDVRAIDLAIGQFLLCGVCNLILETTLRAPHHNCVGPGDHLAGRTDYEAAAIQATRSRLEIDFIPGTDILRELVEQCGQDYRRTTAEEMDNLDILLCCRSCECMVVWRDGREIMNWRAAVSFMGIIAVAWINFSLR